MVYRVSVRSNPRILALYLALPLIVAAGIGALLLIGILYGLLALGAALFLVWTFVRLAHRQLATRVETLTDEILFNLHGDQKILFPWETIRLAGIAQENDAAGNPRKRGRWLFVYNEQEDRMIAFPDELENLDALAAEIREKTDFRELVLAPGETLKGKLREIVDPPKEAAEAHTDPGEPAAGH